MLVSVAQEFFFPKGHLGIKLLQKILPSSLWFFKTCFSLSFWLQPFVSAPFWQLRQLCLLLVHELLLFSLTRYPWTACWRRGIWKHPFPLCSFHACVPGRLKFGPGGWSGRYPITLEISARVAAPSNCPEAHRKVRSGQVITHQGHFHSITRLYCVRETQLFPWSWYLSSWCFMMLLVRRKIN